MARCKRHNVRMPEPYLPNTIRTARLELIPATAALIRHEIDDHTALGAALNAVIPAAWPPEELREVLAFFANRLAEQEQQIGIGPWVVYYWISTAEPEAPRLLIGSGGFMGPPTPDGTVEIGYGTLLTYRRKGYAAEAARGLAEFARSHPDVSQVVADALPANAPSVGVLARSNFVETGDGAEEGTRRFTYTPYLPSVS